MTREEIKTVVELFISWNGETAPIDTSNLDSAVDYINECIKPQMPSNLDEAANKFGFKETLERLREGGITRKNEGMFRWQIEKAFKVGAEWMVGQGVSADSEVSKLANRAWVTARNEKQFMQDVYDNFVAGEEVIIQIRKKQ